jgi:hypothetical protein
MLWLRCRDRILGRDWIVKFNFFFSYDCMLGMIQIAFLRRFFLGGGVERPLDAAALYACFM